MQASFESPAILASIKNQLAIGGIDLIITKIINKVKNALKVFVLIFLFNKSKYLIPENSILIKCNPITPKINGNKNIEILQTNASESDQVNFIKLINKYDLFARTLRSFMFKKPPRVKSGSRSDIWQLVSMGLKVRLLGKKNMRELLRVIGLNIADDLEDNITDNILKGLLSNEAVIGTNLGARSPGSILNLLYNQATNNSIFRINKYNTNSFLNSIREICKKNNVEIESNKKVEKINISNQKITELDIKKIIYF